MSSNLKPFMNKNETSNADCLQRLVGQLVEALTRISTCQDAPDIDPVGDVEFGLHCGVEDRSCTDRYDGANFGYAQGVERTLEWASNEAKHALAMLPNEKS